MKQVITFCEYFRADSSPVLSSILKPRLKMNKTFFPCETVIVFYKDSESILIHLDFLFVHLCCPLAILIVLVWHPSLLRLSLCLYNG